MTTEGEGPETLWRCPSCLAEVQSKVTSSTFGAGVQWGCRSCGVQMRIVKLDDMDIEEWKGVEGDGGAGA